MAQVLAALGKEVRIVNAQATPANLSFIDRGGADSRPGPRRVTERVDGVRLLDGARYQRLGATGRNGRRHSRQPRLKRSCSTIISAATISGPRCSATSRPRPPADWFEAARRAGRAAYARDCHASVRGHRHRHRLVSLRVDHRRHVPLWRAIGRRRCAVPRRFTTPSTSRTRWRACNYVGRVLAQDADRTRRAARLHIRLARGFRGHRRRRRRHRRRREHDARDLRAPKLR